MSSPVNTTPFQGGQKLMMGAGVLGLLGLAATAFGFMSDPGKTAPAYLVAFLYWVGISVGGICMVGIFHAGGGQWMTVLRRQMERIGTFVWVGALLFIPIFLFRKNLFVWTHLEHGQEASEYIKNTMTEHFQHLMHTEGTGKSMWLSSMGLAIRAVVVFAFWGVLAFLQNKWSIDQDSKAPDQATRDRLQRFSAGTLLFLGFSITIAAIDWVMSLEPEWASAMIGVYYFSASFFACWAVLALTSAVPMDPNHHSGHISGHHLHNIGKMMLAFTAFWGYIAYDQLVIIWHANMPEETPWFFARGLSGLSEWTGPVPDPESAKWFPLFMMLVFGHFVVPMLLLLPAPWKRSRKYLTFVAVWMLAMHYCDMYFLVVPAMRLLNIEYTAPHPGWQDLTAFIGIGGVAIAWVLFQMRGKHAIPINDPALAYSLKYVNPL